MSSYRPCGGCGKSIKYDRTRKTTYCIECYNQSRRGERGRQGALPIQSPGVRDDAILMVQAVNDLHAALWREHPLILEHLANYGSGNVRRSRAA